MVDDGNSIISMENSCTSHRHLKIEYGIIAFFLTGIILLPNHATYRKRKETENQLRPLHTVSVGSGVITLRLEKEIACYIKERDEEKKKLEDMKNNHADVYDVKQMVCFDCRMIMHRKR